MGILLAIVVGVASILNLMYGQNQPIQYLLTVLSVKILSFQNFRKVFQKWNI